MAEAATREKFAWAMYDFANSGYTTVVLTTVYNAYFVAVIAGSLEPGTATFLWTLTVGIGNAIVLVSGPVVGAMADARVWKKQILAVTTLGCILGTAALGLAGPGEIALAMALVVVSLVMFASGENLISAFLPEIVDQSHIGRMSGYGWGVGYIGGIMTLGVCLGYVEWARGRGIGETEFVPVTLLITAGIFALAAAPTLIWLRDRGRPQASFSYVKAGFQRVRETLADTRRFRDLFRFLLALVVFQSGVATVIVIAAVYAREVAGFDSLELIFMVMVVNVAAAAGSLVMGYLQDRIGFVPSLSRSLVVWLIAIILVFLAQTKGHIWFAANVIGLAMGASQAGGRALIGVLTPENRSGEFYGLWGLASRCAAIVGPMSYGAIVVMTAGNQRIAVLSTIAFFAVGLAILATVDEDRGIAAAQRLPA